MDKLFSLRTEIGGELVALDVYPDSDLLEVCSRMCKQHGLDAQSQRLLLDMVTDELRRTLESEEQDLEWKYELSCVLQRMLDKCEQGSTPTSSSTQYFKSQAKKAAPRQKPQQKPLDRTVSLHERAMKLQEKRQLLHEQNKLQQESKELQQCTFQPNINTSSSNTFRKRRLQQENIYDALYHEARSIESKKNKRRMQITQEQTIPTFVPQLNQCSLRIVELKGKEEIAKRATPKSTVKQVEFPFKPTISKESKRIASQYPNFWQRVEQETTIYHTRKSQPVSKRPKLGQENRDPQLNPRSLQILETKKHNIFQFVFEQLQCQGEVYADSINKNSCLMEVEQFEVVRPLLEEITTLEVNLNRQEFIQSMEVLYNALSPQDKSILIGHNIRAKWEDQHEAYRNQFTFRPKISQPPVKEKSKAATFQHTGDTLFYKGCEVIEEDEAETSQSSSYAFPTSSDE